MLASTVRPVVVLDPLFDEAGAAAMLSLCEAYGRYRLYAEHEQIQLDLGKGLPQRYDSVRNYLRVNRNRRRDSAAADVAARTSYFREEYAYGATEYAPGIGPFLGHAGLADAAREVHGRPIVEPVIAYANLYLPGQELAVHTDVPEFRGANRKLFPQWLLVVMHHSGLFHDWRLPIATGVAYFHDTDGGALVYWPDGADAPPAHYAARPNTALVLDTDTVFHGVEPVGSDLVVSMPPLAVGASLVAAGDGAWSLRDAQDRQTARYDFEALRFSVSWKAYCFRDEAERESWRAHTADLTYDLILDRLTRDLRGRGQVGGDVVADRDLGLLMIDEYVRFPK
ncbi:MAG: hypothetical protein ACRDWD_13765 [Acidimicrobiia bacterium]